MRPFSLQARALAALLIPLPAALAQGVQLDWPAACDIVSAGDVDGDGVPDYAAGDCDPGGALPGVVRFRSGVDGAEIRAVTGSAPGDGFGARLASLGDVDGDGVGDVAVLASQAGATYLRAVSGASGATVWQVGPPAPAAEFGARLANAGDIDLDGADDVLVDVGAAGASHDRVALLSGATGATLRVLVPVGVTTPHVVSAAGLDDLDGDGVPELGVGVDDLGVSGGGRVLVHSGQSGGVLLALAAPPGEPAFGASIARADDVDGDGTPDFLVGSPSSRFEPADFTSRVRIHSGADGSVLRTIQPSTPNEQNLRAFGRTVAPFDDLDGDGLRDVALSAGERRIGCCTFVSAEFRVYSSASAALLYLGPGQTELREVVPDANGDGVSDYLFGGVLAAGGAFHDALAVTGWTGPFEVCPAQKPNSLGCTPVLGAEGTPSLTLGADLTLRADRAMPGEPGLFAWSRDFRARPFRGGLLCLANPLVRLPPGTTTAAGATCPANGQTLGSLQHTLSKADLLAFGFLPGDAFLVQGFFRDPGYPPPLDLGMTGAHVVVVWP